MTGRGSKRDATYKGPRDLEGRLGNGPVDEADQDRVCAMSELSPMCSEGKLCTSRS
jgi:hypothetical protein